MSNRAVYTLATLVLALLIAGLGLYLLIRDPGAPDSQAPAAEPSQEAPTPEAAETAEAPAPTPSETEATAEEEAEASQPQETAEEAPASDAAREPTETEPQSDTTESAVPSDSDTSPSDASPDVSTLDLSDQSAESLATSLALLDQAIASLEAAVASGDASPRAATRLAQLRARRAVLAERLAALETAPVETLAEETPAEASQVLVAESLITPLAPTFDTVRINPAGTFVAAGTAPPGARVQILINGQVVGEEIADAGGDWVYVQIDPLETGELAISARALLDDGQALLSSQTVVSFLPEREETSPTRAETNPVTVVLDAELGSTRVLQGTAAQTLASGEAIAQDTPGLDGAQVLIQAIDYTPDGLIALVGQGRPGAYVQLYLQDTLLGETRVPASGRWQLAPEAEMGEEQVMLQVIQTGRDGEDLGSSSVPFSRQGAEAGFGAGRAFVVRRGDHLWRIASNYYGEGERYTVIYDANLQAIRNPDLIYPNQVFIIPHPESSPLEE